MLRSRAFWPKSTNTPSWSATFHVVVAISGTRLSTSWASDLAKLRTALKPSPGRIGARMCRPVAPDVFGKLGIFNSFITSCTARAISRTCSHGSSGPGSRSMSR